jgi:hypothetical protein
MSSTQSPDGAHGAGSPGWPFLFSTSLQPISWLPVYGQPFARPFPDFAGKRFEVKGVVPSYRRLFTCFAAATGALPRMFYWQPFVFESHLSRLGVGDGFSGAFSSDTTLARAPFAPNIFQAAARSRRPAGQP